MARMDHLENRRWIEESRQRALWLGKAFIRCIDNKDLLRLAMENYERRQLVYSKELQELRKKAVERLLRRRRVWSTRHPSRADLMGMVEFLASSWCKALGLMDMGFAREKTVYSFAIASSVSFLCEIDSNVRLTITKAAILIVIVDDVFDVKGTIDELRILTTAVQSELIFDALDFITKEVVKKYFDHHGIDIMDNLRQIWYETFSSWLVESTWSKLGKVPFMASCLKNEMISLRTQWFFMLHALLTPTISPLDLNPPRYKEITKFLMISCCLLNDIQGYEDGKVNAVMLYLRENPDSNIGDAIGYLQNILENTKMEVLEHTLIKDAGNLPNSFKMLHLACLKVFQMFYNSTNHFDSKDSLHNDINKAIFTPLEIEEETHNFRPPNPKRLFSHPLKKVVLAPVSNRIRYINLKHDYSQRTSFANPHIISRGNYHVAMTE
ncbi:LOW QUALITY PROTEIN: hypothetical protein Cgig2_012700 [Carnegiea gigantea]|uniref:Terpene synthase metal-binding domain-containing protein n=1 Tax=Carnegiea gigantea TaxID=171969 RepID=A0A9Q1JX58_9CARY|nr:LOW QUALITY PROTEIN: hypothetical protein Cgig2_012700 [Carnegiea gigantea]